MLSAQRKLDLPPVGRSSRRATRRAGRRVQTCHDPMLPTCGSRAERVPVSDELAAPGLFRLRRRVRLGRAVLQQCGRPLDEQAPRYYGVLTPGPAFASGASCSWAGVVALLVGSLIAAIVVLAFAVVALRLLLRRGSAEPRGSGGSVRRRLGPPRTRLGAVRDRVDPAWGRASRCHSAAPRVTIAPARARADAALAR